MPEGLKPKRYTAPGAEATEEKGILGTSLVAELELDMAMISPAEKKFSGEILLFEAISIFLRFSILSLAPVFPNYI